MTKIYTLRELMFELRDLGVPCEGMARSSDAVLNGEYIICTARVGVQLERGVPQVFVWDRTEYLITYFLFEGERMEDLAELVKEKILATERGMFDIAGSASLPPDWDPGEPDGFYITGGDEDSILDAEFLGDIG